MKKVVSLLATIALMSSLFVNVYAEVPTVNVSVISAEMTDSDLADINTILEDDLGEDPLTIDEGYKAYKVTFNVSNAPVFDSTAKNRVMAFEGSLSFANGGYADAQSVAVFGDSVFSADAVLDGSVYKATYVKSAYKDMYQVSETTIDNAIVMAVVAKPGTVATLGAVYTEWHNAPKSEVNANVVLDKATITLGASDDDDDDEEEITVLDEVVTGYTGEKTLKLIAKVLETVDASKKVAITNTTTGERRESGRTLAQIVNGVAVDNNVISGTIAVGVLTADANDVFTFELY